MRYPRVLLAVNKKSRRGGEMEERAREQLERCGHSVEVAPCHDAESMRRHFVAARDRVDVVVLGGGDGTLVSALPALLESKLPFAIIPLGTFNELARTLGVPLAVEDACMTIESGTAKPLDIGCVNGKYYFNEASIGLSARIAHFQTSALKKRLGPLAIPYTTIRGLRHMMPFIAEVTFGEERLRLRTLQLTVANSHRFGGLIENPDAAIDDGQLDLYSFDFEGWRHVLSIALSVITKRFPDAEGVVTRRAPAFRVQTRRPHVVDADAEPVTKTPAEFSVLPAAVRVVVPA